MVAAATMSSDGLDRLELHFGCMILQLGLGQARVLVRRQALNGTGDRLWQDAGLEDAAAVISWAVVVETLADDFAAFDYDRTVAVVEGRQTRLLDTKIEVRIGLHCCNNLKDGALRWEYYYLD